MTTTPLIQVTTKNEYGIFESTESMKDSTSLYEKKSCSVYKKSHQNNTPTEKINRKYNGFNGFNGNYNGVYMYVMYYIGEMLNLIGKINKTHYKKEFYNGFTGKR